MKVRVLLISVIFLFFGCKSAEKVIVTNYKIKLSDYVKMYSDKGVLSKDPLIIVNSKPYKLYSELNEDDVDLMEQSSKSYSYFKQKNKYFIDKLGAKAYGGIIHIKNVITLYCGVSNHETTFMVNDNNVNFKEFDKLLTNKEYKYFNSISRLKLDNDEYVSILILETK